MGPLLDAASGLRGVLIGWIIPTLVWVSVGLACITVVIPEADLSRMMITASWAERSAWVVGIAAAIGILLSSVQTALFRVLEGYVGPVGTRARLSGRHNARRADLKRRYDHATAQASRNVLLDQLREYPIEEGDYLPTRFGNVIKAAETYGWDRYRLDLVGLWYQIINSVPSDLREDTAKARIMVDFHVCSLYLSFAIGIALTVTSVTLGLPTITIAALGVGTICLAVLFYLAAVSAAKEWGRSLIAVADFCRMPLAKTFNLQLPPTLEQERELWRAVGHLVKYPYTAARSAALAAYAIRPHQSSVTTETLLQRGVRRLFRLH